MHYKQEHIYKAPVELVVEGLMETPGGLYSLTDLENVSTNKLLEERDEGGFKYIVAEWNVHGQIPPVAQKLIRPEMLTFLEKSTWNRKTWEYSYKIEPHHFKKQIECHGVTSFHKKDNNTTIRRIEAELKIFIPLLGPLLENWIIVHLKKNADQDYEISSKAFYAWVEREGKMKK